MYSVAVKILFFFKNIVTVIWWVFFFNFRIQLIVSYACSTCGSLFVEESLKTYHPWVSGHDLVFCLSRYSSCRCVLLCPSHKSDNLSIYSGMHTLFAAESGCFQCDSVIFWFSDFSNFFNCFYFYFYLFICCFTYSVFTLQLPCSYLPMTSTTGILLVLVCMSATILLGLLTRYGITLHV